MKQPTFPRRLVLAWCLVATVVALASCSLRWQGREALGWDPDLDVWMHHPQRGLTNAPPY